MANVGAFMLVIFFLVVSPSALRKHSNQRFSAYSAPIDDFQKTGQRWLPLIRASKSRQVSVSKVTTIKNLASSSTLEVTTLIVSTSQENDQKSSLPIDSTVIQGDETLEPETVSSEVLESSSLPLPSSKLSKPTIQPKSESKKTESSVVSEPNTDQNSSPKFPKSEQNKFSQDVLNIIASNNNLGIKLFHALNHLNKGTNVLISPISLFSTLVTVYAGSSSLTQDEMINLLNLRGMKQSQVERAFREISHALLYRVGSGNNIKMLNAILIDQNVNVSSRFVNRIRTYYNAYLEKVGFNSEPQYVLSWTNELVSWWTQGLIPEILDGPPDPLTKMLLINAIYFKGKWKQPFDPELTIKSPFKNADGAIAQVDLMRQISKFDFYCDQAKYKVCALEMPYSGDGLSFMVITSYDGISDARNIETELNTTMIKELSEQMTRSPLEFGLPKFSLTAHYDLLKPLEELGMKSAFSPESADLSQMGDSKELFVREAKHKTLMQIDEEGTSAAGSTVAEIGTRKRSRRFILNKPFIFLVKDVNTEAILFLGKINLLP